MEIAEIGPNPQNRTAFRTRLLPDEFAVGRFWIHDPGIRFSESPLAPEEDVLFLEGGVILVNISAGGALARIVTPPGVALLRLVSIAAEGQDGTSQAVPPFRDVSMTLHIDLRKDLQDILVSGSIVRTTLVRISAATTEYELALKFYN